MEAEMIAATEIELLYFIDWASARRDFVKSYAAVSTSDRNL